MFILVNNYNETVTKAQLVTNLKVKSKNTHNCFRMQEETYIHHGTKRFVPLLLQGVLGL